VITEEIILLMAKHTREISGMNRLCLAGGVALNSVANGKLQKQDFFEELFIQPAAGDAGGAVGAALTANHIYFGRERIVEQGDLMQNAYLGPQFPDAEIEITIRKHGAAFEKYRAEEELLDEVVRQLLEGKVIGWFTGRMEFGPRALGNRSIIGSPLLPDMQKLINQKIKLREGFRPFAAITTEEDASSFFDMEGRSPYMLLVHPIHKQHLRPLPADYSVSSMDEKLNTPKSVLPAITHVDLTCRIQTIGKNDNPRFWNLLNRFKEKTGFSVLINTSFNVRGEPIVCTPDEAYAGFMRTGMDVLVMENFLFKKEQQPEWVEKADLYKYVNSD
jgi:carbamoyltransferase